MSAGLLLQCAERLGELAVAEILEWGKPAGRPNTRQGKPHYLRGRFRGRITSILFIAFHSDHAINSME